MNPDEQLREILATTTNPHVEHLARVALGEGDQGRYAYQRELAAAALGVTLDVEDTPESVEDLSDER